MERAEILARLSQLTFCALWPGDWADIGFTERPIWVNSSGYGYYLCDEPCSFFVIDNCSAAHVRFLKEKMLSGELAQEDVDKSPIAVLLDAYDDSSRDEYLKLLDKVSMFNSIRFFAGETNDGWELFGTAEEMTLFFDQYARDFYCEGEAWNEMSDKQLQLWYARLFEEKPEFVFPIQ